MGSDALVTGDVATGKAARGFSTLPYAEFVIVFFSTYATDNFVSVEVV